jgi:6-phosphogluconolactonase
MSRLIHYPDRAALMTGLAATVAAELGAGLETGRAVTLAVPGGTTPAPFFKILRRAGIDWSRVRVMLTDERFVPEDSGRSNTRLVRQTLLQDRAQAATLIPMYRAAETPEDVLDLLTTEVSAALPLDVCVLGMGADMHTASLFPGADLLDQALGRDAPPLLPMRAKGAPEPRMTLTAPVLQAAGHTHLLITGADKKAAYELALQDGPTAQAPVRVVLRASPPALVHYAD